MKSMTLALGALVATSAAVYINAQHAPDDDDLVAPRAVVVKPIGMSDPADSNVAPKSSSESKASNEPTVAEGLPSAKAVSLHRDPSAASARFELFRALEAPPKVVTTTEAIIPEKVAPVVPKPAFNLIGTFRDAGELQAIIQNGESVEFASINQVIAGFRVTSIDPTAIGWTHEPTDARGVLNARGAR
jgi:hypothetical protein